MNAYGNGKIEETVDFGQEMDYSGYEWFKDAPTLDSLRPMQSVPSTMQEQYMPLPNVIEQNEMFDYALKSAPNVLYQRFKQYGQLGVLGWCSEFGEMIDALKQLGMEGNMFVGTRAQALKTCEEVLSLKMDVKMQIIILYLSGQVQRLRRFLDGERQFEDYPESEFPVNYPGTSKQ